MEARDEYGVVGLGRIGGNLARQALEKDIRVVGFTRPGAPEDMIEAGLTEVLADDASAGAKAGLALDTSERYGLTAAVA